MELTKKLSFFFFFFSFLDNVHFYLDGFYLDFYLVRFYLDGESPGNEFGARCYSGMGIPAFWASPFPKP